MANDDITDVANLVESILGSSRREPIVDGWTEYNCPYCAEENCGIVDNKYNCCINYKCGTYHCWKCGNSGKVSKIIKIYGGYDKLEEYKNCLKEIKSCRMYSLSNNNFDNNVDLLSNEDSLSLPNDYIPLWQNNTLMAKEAIEYLAKRRIGQELIKKHNIGYVGSLSKDYKMRNRIIVPSYNEFGELNYYIARDYSGKQSNFKYMNPKIPKTQYIFDENMINWYEDITLVEGVFDHMVIPNSIPLLGKKLERTDAVYKSIVNKSMANINILLDDDAIHDAKCLYRNLNNVLCNKIRLIECPDGFDASLIYQKYGINGVKQLMLSKRKIDEFELMFN